MCPCRRVLLPLLGATRMVWAGRITVNHFVWNVPIWAHFTSASRSDKDGVDRKNHIKPLCGIHGGFWELKSKNIWSTKFTKVNPGIWYWKEDTRSLEFVSAQFKEETKDTKEKAKKGGKAIHFQDPGAKQVDRPRPSLFRDLYAIQPPFQDEKPTRLGKRGQNELITLEDVKYAALFLAHEDESISIPSFSVVMRCKQLDDFLMALLYYISFYLEKIALENKPKSAMGAPSAMEKKEIKQNQINLAVTKKHLAEVYCILILGLGMSEQHHMACGKRKISTSRKDREFFECLYRFSAYVAFVAFQHRNLKEIQMEVGRLLRSNIFNPALREKTEPEEFLKIALSNDVKKTTLSFCKHKNIKHPAIRSVTDTRSPVLSTLLPMPKDSAQYLFQDHYLHPGKTAPSFSPEELPELSSIVTASKIGIIGCLRNKFIPHTLQPVGNLEDGNEDRESLRSKTSASSLMTREVTSTTKSTHSAGSRPSMVISRTTTEADYSENPV